MSEKLHEMLAFVFEKEAGLTRGKARSVAAHFADLEEFATVSEAGLRHVRSITGRRAINLSDDEAAAVVALSRGRAVSAARSVEDNFLEAVGRDFTRRQVDMLRRLRLANLAPNPFLISSLHLDTPQEVVRVNVYMSATRSIVTSMGFFLERLVLASSETVERPAGRSGWDVVKTDSSGHEHWIQVKSGPNDMDKDQIVYWSDKIAEKVEAGSRAYIGIAYGRRTQDTVTIGLLRRLLPDWEVKTLFGKELWDFVSDREHYHLTVLERLRSAAHSVLGHGSVADELERCVESVTAEFIEQYGAGAEGVSRYIGELM